METANTNSTSMGHTQAALTKELNEFRNKVQGRIVTENDDEYETARKIWNGMIDKRPLAIVKCTSESDVKNAVSFVRDNNLKLSVRGGGHNVAGNSLCDGGVVIDLSLMNQVTVDPEKKVVRVSGGATLGDVDRETLKYNLAAPLGVVPRTGVAGLALHGGLGINTRKYGLTADNLIAAEIVTADGKLRKVDEEQEHELLWALKGGGGSFGVVTSFTFKLFRVETEVFLSMVMYPIDVAVGHMRKWRDLMANAPDEVMSLSLLWSFPDEEHIPEEYKHQPCLVIVASYAGTVKEGEMATQPFRELSNPVADLSGPMPYIDVQQIFDPEYPDGRHYYWKSTYVDALDDELIEALKHHATQRPSILSSLDIWSLGGAMGRIEKSESAFAQRDALFLIALESNWDDPADDEVNVTWSRQVMNDLQRFSNGATYLNFAGFGEDNSDMVRKTFGENFQKLRLIKERYDPEDLFSSSFNIR